MSEQTDRLFAGKNLAVAYAKLVAENCDSGIYNIEMKSAIGAKQKVWHLATCTQPHPPLAQHQQVSVRALARYRTGPACCFSDPAAVDQAFSMMQRFPSGFAAARSRWFWKLWSHVVRTGTLGDTDVQASAWFPGTLTGNTADIASPAGTHDAPVSLVFVEFIEPAQMFSTAATLRLVATASRGRIPLSDAELDAVRQMLRREWRLCGPGHVDVSCVAAVGAHDARTFAGSSELDTVVLAHLPDTRAAVDAVGLAATGDFDLETWRDVVAALVP